jgi:hypothetical protein
VSCCVNRSGADTGAIIGGVVGGVSGLCVFLLLLLALLFIFALKRKRNRQKKLSQPDYEELAYADVDDVVMTKKMQEVCDTHANVGCRSDLIAMSAHTPVLRSFGQPQYYSQLERLMFVDDGRLATAIFEIASSTDADKVNTALWRACPVWRC